jgi:hypothetical protein
VASALAERGSMLPLFLGLAAVATLLSLGAAEICSVTIYREQVQQVADQTALVAAAEQLVEAGQVKSKVSILTSNPEVIVDHYSLNPDHTAELRICGIWKSWLRLPGLNLNQDVCAESAAR